MKVQWFKVHSKARSRLSLTHSSTTVEQSKIGYGPIVRVISPVVKEMVYGEKDLLKSQVLSSEWNTERVREDASGEDGEDDEMPCVIEESAGDCVWRGSRRSVGSSFHREGAAYLKERFVIFKDERWASKSCDHRWRTCVVRRLNRDRVTTNEALILRFLPASIALQADYVTVVENRPYNVRKILSASSSLSCTFGQN